MIRTVLSARRRRTQGATLLALVGASALVAGCAGSPSASKATVDPTQIAVEVNASASASATAKATPQTLSPEEEKLRQAALAFPLPEPIAGMNENTPDGAIASGMYFMALFPYVFSTGDLTQWKAMSEDRCVFCKSVVDNVNKIVTSVNGWDDPYSFTVTDAWYRAPDPGKEYSLVTLTMDIDGHTYHYGNGKTDYSEEVVGQKLYIAMHYVNGRWMIGGGDTDLSDDNVGAE